MTQKIQEQPKTARQSLTKTLNQENTSSPHISFSDHIAELRRRIFVVVLIFLAASALAYQYKDALLHAIMNPLGDQKLIYLTPGGGFNFIFLIALYAGLIATAPMLIYQLYGFIRPALPKKAQRSAVMVVLVACLLMLAGVAFGYFVAVPAALQFLSQFAGDTVTPTLTADSYLNFFLAYIAGLGILFELPLLLLFFHWVHPMTPKGLLKSERFVIVFAFIAAAIITPTPDMLNQAMIAVPLILIYQFGVIAVLIAIRRERRSQNHRQVKAMPKESAKPAAPLQSDSKTQPQISHRVSAAAPLPTRSIDGFSSRGRLAPRTSPPLTPPKRTTVSMSGRVTNRRSLAIDGIVIPSQAED
ncbi:MAG TPA: twin-arginine translocase subunit TatC [Candidatus Saccharimonadales bacterium]|nr:twin-arginine translocase subunit TatC [Candidatus Saccharimonadales bacterium]